MSTGLPSSVLAPAISSVTGTLPLAVPASSMTNSFPSVALEAEGRDVPVEALLAEVGAVPLPPYITRAVEAADSERYQTLFARVPGVKGGRVVDDFVCLPDLAPTFMEIGGVKPPAGLYGRSLLPVLKSDRSGQIEADRTWVITGRERHVDVARAGNLPYPMRAFRTKDFVYIRNFMPDRMPMGDPKEALKRESLESGALQEDTRIGYADMDSSPTKAWLIAHRNDPKWKWHFDHAFGQRPGEELYDLRKDPHQVKNVAADPAYAKTKAGLSTQLMEKLTAAGDPRVTGDRMKFERPPFTDTSADLPAAPAGKQGRKKNKKAE